METRGFLRTSSWWPSVSNRFTWIFLNQTIILDCTVNLDSLFFTALHRDWLLKQKIRDESGQLHSKYSVTEVEKYVNALPAYLSDRCYDMQGHRGANAKKRGRDLNVSECKQSGPTKPKRKYIRRGQPLLKIPQHQLPSLQQPSIQQSFPTQQPLPQQQSPQQSHQEPLPHTDRKK